MDPHLGPSIICLLFYYSQGLKIKMLVNCIHLYVASYRLFAIAVGSVVHPYIYVAWTLLILSAKKIQVA